MTCVRIRPNIAIIEAEFKPPRDSGLRAAFSIKITQVGRALFCNSALINKGVY